MEFCTANGRLQPGFRFYPTDEELVMYYLKRKVLGKPLEPAVVAEVDLYKFHPEDLRGIANLKKDRNWYFFCPRGKKYGCGDRTNRATTTGYWKATGNDRDVMYQQRSVGKIKTLVFHQGKPPKGDRTDWVMHEFKLDDKKLADVGVSQDSYVLCKIFKKSGLGPKNGEQYGAPFMEEEWDDDDEIPDCAQMVPADVQNQSISAVTDVMECTNACPSYTSEQVYSGSVSVSAVDQAPPPSTSNAAVANVVSSPSVLIPNYSHAIDHAHTPMPIASDWTSCSMTYSGAVSVSAVDQSPASTSNAAAKPASSSKGRILSTTAMPVCAYNAAANLASSSKCPIPYYNGAGVNQATAENVASSSKGPIPYYNATAVNQGTAAMPVHAYNSAVNQTSAAMPLHSYWASSSNIAFPNYYDPSVQMPTSAMPMIAAADIAPASTGPVQFYDDDEIFTAYDLGEVFGGLEDLDNRIVQGNESAWENFYEGGLALDDLDESL